jgi:hypothetical protein
VLPVQRGAVLGGPLYVRAEEMGEADACHGPAVGPEEQLWHRHVAADGEPGPHILRRLLPEGQGAMPAAFALAMKRRGGVAR